MFSELSVKSIQKKTSFGGEDHINYTQEESAFLLSGLEFIHNQTTLGVNIVQVNGKQKFHVPYLRALEYIKVYLENKQNKLTGHKIKVVKNELENLKDSKNISGVVNIDSFMAKVLDNYTNLYTQNKAKIISQPKHQKNTNNLKTNKSQYTIYHFAQDFQHIFKLVQPQKQIQRISKQNQQRGIKNFFIVSASVIEISLGVIDYGINCYKVKKFQDKVSNITKVIKSKSEVLSETEREVQIATFQIIDKITEEDLKYNNFIFQEIVSNVLQNEKSEFADNPYWKLGIDHSLRALNLQNNFGKQFQMRIWN